MAGRAAAFQRRSYISPLLYSKSLLNVYNDSCEQAHIHGNFPFSC